MGHLSKIAKEAKQCGMSYGNYVAMQYERRGYKPEPKPEEDDGAWVDSQYRKCVICGNFLPFGALKHQTTCSSQCSAERNRRNSREHYRKNIKVKPKVTVKCEQCGAEFLQNRQNQRFCCKKCQEDYKYERVGKIKGRNSMKDRNYGTGICAACGAEFLKRSAVQKTCSHSCYNRMRSQKKRKDKKC